MNTTSARPTHAPPAFPSGLRVGVDGFNMAMPRGTGVATYGRVLAQTLNALGCRVDMLFGMTLGERTPPAMRQIVFFDKLDQETGRKPPGLLSPRWFSEVARTPLGVRAFDVPVDGRVVTAQFAGRLPKFERLLNATDLFDVATRYFHRTKRFLRVSLPNPPDIMHWTYPIPVTLHGARNVYTLHDLVPLRLPYTTLDNKRAYSRLVRGCLRWGDHVCTVSEASRNDIMTLLDAPADAVTNTYQTATLPPLPVADAELEGWLAGLFGLQRGGYLLFYGALEPKKNVGRLIEAYLGSGITTPLVIVGGRAWRAENELRLVQKKDGQRVAARTGRIELLDYVPSPWLSALVKGARAVMFPSLYEGFGLPVLEAMQQGTPVLTSTESSLPEVAGEAALLVNPYNIGEITAAIQAMDGDPALRDRLRAAGLMQAQRFSGAAYGARLMDVYGRVLGRPS